MSADTTCAHCAQPIRGTDDPNCPWIHVRSVNSFCDVHAPADAFTNAQLPNRTEATPAGITRYVATINVPGYLPMDDDPPVFDSAREAWQYLVGEVDRAWELWTDSATESVCSPCAQHYARMPAWQWQFTLIPRIPLCSACGGELSYGCPATPGGSGKHIVRSS